MAQPRGSLPHDDHFHVRISCPSFMEACVEYPTRNLARTKLLRPRLRGVQSAPATTTHVAQPPAGGARPIAPPPPPPVEKAGSDEERYGSVGSGPAAPKQSATVAPPAPPVPIAPEIDPPALLDVPIDDVDGVVQ
jgi:penicillin-insensitive murein endopeptidase